MLLRGKLGLLALHQVIHVVGGVGVVLHGLLEAVVHLRTEHVHQLGLPLRLLTNGLYVQLVFTALSLANCEIFGLVLLLVDLICELFSRLFVSVLGFGVEIVLGVRGRRLSGSFGRLYLDLPGV